MGDRSAGHVADAHEVIRVVGARENNLKNVSLEIPKRRLTVFTGVSGSGKSSLVFGTIAAESQRLINETYSTFMQQFMAAADRPDVDALENLSPAILVDQERMGANARSTVGTATDAHAMLRMLFSRLGTPHDRFSAGVLVQRALGERRRASSRTDEQGQEGARGRSRSRAGCARTARGSARRATSTSTNCSTGQVARRGRHHDPRLQRRRVDGARLHRVGVPRRRQADPGLHRAGAPGLPLQGARQGQDARTST